MGGVQVNCVDQNNNPLAGVVCILSVYVFPTNEVRDTQVTGPSGSVFLDSHSVICVAAQWNVDAIYAGQKQSRGGWLNPQCFAPLQNFQFNVSPLGCSEVNPCPTGFACVNGQCVFTGCQSAADCPPNNICVNHQCVPLPPSGCQSDSDCPSGYNCVSGVCKQIPTSEGSLLTFIVAGLIVIGVGVAVAGRGGWNEATVTKRKRSKRRRG